MKVTDAREDVTVEGDASTGSIAPSKKTTKAKGKKKGAEHVHRMRVGLGGYSFCEIKGCGYTVRT